MQEPQGQLPTMLRQVNTDLGFSLEKSLVVHVDFIPSKQDDIFSMSAKGLIIIGIQEGT